MILETLFKKENKAGVNPHRAKKGTEAMINEIIDEVINNPVLNNPRSICYGAFEGMLREIEKKAEEMGDRDGQYTVSAMLDSMTSRQTEEMLGKNWTVIRKQFPDGARLRDDISPKVYAQAAAYAAYLECCGEVQGIYDEDLGRKAEQAVLNVWESCG